MEIRENLISIIMSIYEEPFIWVIEALDSIIHQTYRNKELIIVVDNPDYYPLPQLKDKIEEMDFPIKLIINRENLGLVNSLNLGIQVAQGSYLARMDADDVMLPDRLKKEMFFLKNNQLDLVASSISSIDENDRYIKSNSIHHNLIGVQVLKLEKINNFFWHPTWLARKEVFTTLSAYRNIPSVEDYDFVARSLVCGYKLGMMKDKLVKKRANTHSISSVNEYRQFLISKIIRKNLRRGIITPEKEIQKAISVSDSIREKKRYVMAKRVIDQISLNDKFLLILKSIKFSFFISFSYYARELFIDKCKQRFLFSITRMIRY
ncbi:glycosyltransferase [Oenococcus kitaharae]|uniref:Glycosyltransferase n=1 Tax=Oenococcus kitaharae DSM 17330 TaxID=1045004 RepID=G9WIQ1_9LACO|nr:glycosyltransferase [Oenococcus kitaharae]EHN58190.1 Glycosyltransferase [Oenococcus kitaharae DSM 17330]